MSAAFLFSACQLFLGREPDTGPSEVLRSLWNDFNDIHANLDFRMSGNLNYDSWYDVYHNKQTGYALKIKSDMSETSLFDVCADMLEEIKDPHVGLYAPGLGYRSYNADIDEYFDIDTVKSYLIGNGNDGYQNFVFGTFSSKPDIGYVYISKFIYEGYEPEGQEWGRIIDNILGVLKETKAIVLDVRDNKGGEVYVMEYIAARFVSETKNYCGVISKNGPGSYDFSAPVIYTVKSISKASDNKYGYTKPIVLLTNINTVSVAEWFVLALRTQSHVTHIGTATCGAFSPRKDRFMINGWTYSISPGRVTDMNGNNYEGIGISPDKEEYIIANTTEEEDVQLEEAVRIASGGD